MKSEQDGKYFVEIENDEELEKLKELILKKIEKSKKIKIKTVLE